MGLRYGVIRLKIDISKINLNSKFGKVAQPLVYFVYNPYNYKVQVSLSYLMDPKQFRIVISILLL